MTQTETRVSLAGVRELTVSERALSVRVLGPPNVVGEQGRRR
jgi:hypothetical protein